MRALTDHIVSGDQAVQLQIEVRDEPGAGGANHQYVIMLPPLTPPGVCNAYDIDFQNGPIKEAGVNGITQEALAAIIIDRLRCFQAGPFACEDNAEAQAHFEAGLKCLQRRTLARIARGVEGTDQK
jgi:hypothetical protein